MRSELTPSSEGGRDQQVSNNNNDNYNHNTAPENRRSRVNQNDTNKTSNSTTILNKQTSQKRTLREEEAGLMFEINQKIELRSRKLTICLLSFVAAVSCLSPFVSLHLTHRVGLLLFESDLIQLRSSFYSMIICLFVLVTLYLIIIYIINKNSSNNNRKTWLIQRTFKQLIGFFAIISAISYLSLTLIVPQIRQIHRMPIATFDCNANLITIENCHQQFTSSKGSEQTIFEAINELIAGNLDGNNERLIKKLNCLKYNDKDLYNLEVPTRFLLHKCGLVCKPKRQQLHQFSDDLNKEQQNNHWSQIDTMNSKSFDQQSTIVATTTVVPENNFSNNKQHLVPPYINKALDGSVSSNGDRHYIYHNASSPDSTHFETAKISEDEQNTSQVSLKVCFSGEFIGGSNYKQFCITNLANHRSHNQDQTLTIGQLNAMLKSFIPNPSHLNHHSDVDSTFYSGRMSEKTAENSIEAEETNDQATHYVNPIVQFESHFKNWPHLPIGDGMNSEDSEDSWCKFRPIPPFIVNNKPFSDIQCSLEHEYTMTTGPSLDSISLTGQQGRTDNIYLKKSSSSQSTDDEVNRNGNNNNHNNNNNNNQNSNNNNININAKESIKNERRERCNIQCKVSILYQVRVNKNRATSSNSFKENNNSSDDNLHYYLPLKPCLIVSNDGDKSKTSEYYIFFRSIGDSTLLLSFILLDLFILLETIDTKQFQLEAKKVRFISLLLIITLLPLIVAILFDLTSYYYPSYNLTTSNYANKSKKEGYLITLINERIVPSIIDLFTSSSSSMAKRKKSLPSSSSSLSYDNLIPTDIQTRQNNSSIDQSNEKRHLLASNNFPVIDNFILPFFIYSVFMFIFAINSFLIPLFFSPTPLIRVSSTEELGMAPSQKQTRKQKNETDERMMNNKQRQRQKAFGRNHERIQLINRRFIVKMISLYLICLFMGVQFNLSQSTQTQILIESFGNPTITVGQSYPSFWFTFGTHSSAAIFILMMALIFQNELSGFFSNFSPFKTTASASLDSFETKRNRAKFFTYLSLSLIIYSFRYFAIASIRYKFKHFVAFLFQITEIINFPLTWFALTTRAHEMVTENRVRRKANSLNQSTTKNQISPASDSKDLTSHFIIQSSLALAYFVIAKVVALFLHSIYVSLYLHSENVDWFITGFYKPNKEQQLNSTNASGPATGEKSQSLFSPLPGERQTYLHASRQFLRYNSFFCLITGIIFLIQFIYVRYQIWCEKRRTADISQSHRSPDEFIDERLSLDLKRLHSNSTRTIYPQSDLRRGSTPDLRSESQKKIRSESPRAKILFHYKLDNRDSSSESSLSHSLKERMNRQQRVKPNMSHEFSDSKQDLDSSTSERDIARHKSNTEFRIPIQIERATNEEDFRQLNSKEAQDSEDNEDNDIEVTEFGTISERVVRRRNKRVRISENTEGKPEDDVIFEEKGEDMLDEEDVIATEPHPPTSRVFSKKPENMWQQSVLMRHRGQGIDRANNRKRTISFAPNATLIGEDGFSEHRSERPQSINTPKRASPEPSIGNEDDDYYDSNNEEFENSNRQPDSID